MQTLVPSLDARDDASRPHGPRSPSVNPRPTPHAPRLAHALALLAAVLTWPLLLVGGSVTVYRVGMAVPDWPTTFGVNMFLYDFMNSSWGVFIEHSHRLYGAGVGIACVLLAIVATLGELGLAAGLVLAAAGLAPALAVGLVPTIGAALGLGPFLGAMAVAGLEALGVAVALWLVRRRASALAWLALAAVIGQGVLGGYRVRWNSPFLAFLHGCTAQAFFALVVALGVTTGREWSSPATAGDPAHLRRRAAVTLLLIYAQIVLGAWVRHFGDTRGVVLHAVMASAVWGHALALGIRVLRSRDPAAVRPLVPSAVATLVLATLQVGIGVLAWWLLRPFDGIPRSVWPGQALVRIAHQGMGALLLASGVVLTSRAFRRLGTPSGAFDRAFTDARPSREAVG